MLNLQSCTQKPLNNWTKKDTSLLNNWKACAAQNLSSPALKSRIVFTCGGWNCLQSGPQQEACQGTGTRLWGDYVMWKVCACDVLIMAPCLFGPAGNQGWLQVNVTQINEGWRRWGRAQWASRSKVCLTLSGQTRDWVTNVRPKGPHQSGGSGQEGPTTPATPLADLLLLCKSCKENMSKYSIHSFLKRSYLFMREHACMSWIGG